MSVIKFFVAECSKLCEIYKRISDVQGEIYNPSDFLIKKYPSAPIRKENHVSLKKLRL